MHLYKYIQQFRKWRTEWRVLKKNLDKIGIRGQRRPEKKWLAELLANARVLSYAKDTEVGSREGAAEVTREWRRRGDKEGEEQLGNS